MTSSFTFGFGVLPGVVAWGKSLNGGDTSAVREQLKGVQQIQAAGGVFAAILEDGSVVTWGSPDVGGDRWAIRDQLKDVQRIQATDSAFTAIFESRKEGLPSLLNG